MNFVYLLKEPAFSFTDFCSCFLHLYFIYFCSDFYDVFPSPNFGFCLFLFFQSLQVQDQIVYLRFFLFLEVGLYCYKFPSSDCFCCIPQDLSLCDLAVISFYVVFISFLISSVISWLFSSILFSLPVFVLFQNFFMSNLKVLWSERYLV